MRGGGCVALRGLSVGRASRAVAGAELLAAAARADADPRPVYVDVDAAGFVVPARALAAARLAPAPGARQAVLERAPGAWRLVLRAPAAPHAELLLWPRARLLAQAGVPRLSPHHRIGEGEYACHRCAARFDAPHPLRVHLFLSCRAATALLFYSELLRRLEPAPEPAPVPAPAPLDLRSAFQPYTSVSPSPTPAALEALATAWGRGAGGGAGHACVYCGRLYSRRYGLKIHLRTHTGYKPLRCPHCRRAFGDPSNLNKHVKLHGARGPGAGAGAGSAHACQLCGKLLARRRDLERHLRARHAPPAPEREV